MLLALPVGAMLSAQVLTAQVAKPAGMKVQTVTLTFDDKGYVVTPATVTKGVPVKMEVDLDTVKFTLPLDAQTKKEFRYTLTTRHGTRAE